MTAIMRSASRWAAVSLIFMLLGAETVAQVLVTPGAPGKNVNVVGPTPDPANVRDILLKQQNEPSCTIRSSNPAYIFCAFNDYRATDFPAIQGDSFIGVSWSADFGKTWFSRLTPGYKSHPLSLGMEFAADPSVVSIPGASPGITILNYIAAFRDLDDGVLAIQRYADVPQEDVNYNKAENAIYLAARTNSGRFSDKPAMRFVVDDPNQQRIETVTMELEDGSVVTREVPSGTLVLAYSIFTGSNSSKVGVRRSFNHGEDFTKFIKLSEEQVRVQAVSLTNIGQNLLAAWRRSDSKDDAIIYAFSSNGGNSWTKGKAAISGLCTIDQLATNVQARTFGFPWLANDGERFYIFVADRRFAGDRSCGGGIPRIVMKYSSTGTDWDGPLMVIDNSTDDHPFNEPAAAGYQFMPVSIGYRGNVQVAWWDTRRETYPPGLPEDSPEPLVQDYVTSTGTIVHRKADVYTARIRADADGNIQISPSIRVSRYRTGLDATDAASILQETEAHFPNTPIFDSGGRAFAGDYIGAAVPEFRQQEDGKWIQNSISTGDIATDIENVFLTWGDHRNLRGRFFPDSGPSPYTPNNAAAAAMAASRPDGDADAEKTRVAEVSVDPSWRAESEPDFPAAFGQCIPGDPQDRTRNADVYGSLVEYVTTLVAPTPTKPLSGLLRTLPVVITNPSPDTERVFRLAIANQPPDAVPNGVTGQASWNQLPDRPPFDDPRFPRVEEIDVTVPPSSSAARTMFLATSESDVAITIEMFDASCDPDTQNCPVIASVTVGDGAELLESEFCSEDNPDPNKVCPPVLETETHNPNLQNPDLQAPDLQAARLLSPDLQAPDLQAPDLQAPDLQALGFENPDLQAPDLQAPDLQAPDLQAPDLQAPDLQAQAYQDVTYTLKNVGNVSTSYSTDMSFSGLDPDQIQALLIVWTPYITGTSRECEFLPVAENQVLASKNLTDQELTSLTLPTVADPFAGPLSFAARPGQIVNVTLRLFGPVNLLNSLSDEEVIQNTGFGASSHSCNSDTINPDEDCLTSQIEKIVIDRAPPTFNVPDGTVITAEAQGPDGAFVDLAGDGTITAEDQGQPLPVTCTADPDGSPEPLPTTLPLGSNDVACSATDDAQNTATVDLIVGVEDNVPPSFDPPLNDPDFAITAVADQPVGNPVSAVVVFPLFSASDNVDAAVEISCLPISGSTFPIGVTEVTCTAMDDGPNQSGVANEIQASFDVVVTDGTPPTFPGSPSDFDQTVEANTTGGARFDYARPDFSDNFDAAADLIVTCTPESTASDPAFFPLSAPGPTVTPVTCTATDTSNNEVVVDFAITVQDTAAPLLSVPADDVEAPVDSSGSAIVDFDTLVSATDVDEVDPNPTVSCSPPSGSAFTLGFTEVTCTATDASGNTSPEGRFTVRAQYGQSFGLLFQKGNIQAGSTVPLIFGWLNDGGERIDSSGADPLITIRNCATGEVVVAPAQFPGSSDLKWKASQLEWQFGWQTVDLFGDPLPAERSGTDYCATVESGLTGQVIGPTVITLKP